MLQSFGEDIWIADGQTTAVAGFRYPTRMAIIRLSGGGLFVWSPIQLSEELKAQVDAVGAVRFLIAPNSLHHLFLAEWKQAYPGARLYAAPVLRARRKDIAFDGDLENRPPADWAGDVDQVLMAGNLITTEALFFHRRSGTAIFIDLIQHFAPDWFTAWRAIVARLDLMTSPEPSVPRKFRAAFVDRRAARACLAQIQAWPVDKVLMAHGTPIEKDGRAFISRAFRWLSV
jgi:Domain of unknown function (DUF4336)